MRAPRAAVACSDRREARRLAERGAAVDSLPMLVCACCCVQSLHHGCEVNAWKLRAIPRTAAARLPRRCPRLPPPHAGAAVLAACCWPVLLAVSAHTLFASHAANACMRSRWSHRAPTGLIAHPPRRLCSRGPAWPLPLSPLSLLRSAGRLRMWERAESAASYLSALRRLASAPCRC